MLVLTLCLVSWLLQACSSGPVIRDLTTGVVTVDKPIAVRCIKASDIPPPPAAPLIAADADIEQRAAWAKIRDAQLRQHIVLLRATLLACAGDP